MNLNDNAQRAAFDAAVADLDGQVNLDYIPAARLKLPVIEQHFRQLFVLFLDNYDFNLQLIAREKKQIRCHKHMFIPSDLDKASIVNGS